MRTIRETLSTQVAGIYDVIVAGGGMAGVSAALAAAGEGVSVLLIEKLTLTGGLATAGHSRVFGPLCDGKGHKVTGGLAEALLLKTIEDGRFKLPKAWKDKPLFGTEQKRYQTVYSPGRFALALESMLRQENIHILLDTAFCAPLMEGRRVRGVFVENKSGRQCYLCKAIVDATGDGDVLSRAGAAFAQGSSDPAYECERLGQGKEKTAPLSIVEGNDGALAKRFGKYHGTTATEVNRFLRDTHAIAYEKIKREDVVPVSFPAMAQLYAVRALAGAYTLRDEDVFRRFEDVIALSGDARTPGPIYAIPYRCLYSDKVENLYAAGRCISADNDAWAVARQLPACAATGEAAGVAAAQLGMEKAARLDVSHLQETLRARGVKLDYPKVK